MSFRLCIDNGEKEGVISRQQAEKLRLDYDRIYQEKRATMTEADAAAKASQDTFDTLEFEARESQRRIALMRDVQRTRLAEMESADTKYASEALVRLVERDGSGQWGNSTLEGRREFIRGLAHAKMDNVLFGLKRSAVLGRQRKSAVATGNDMAREVFGDVETGNAAAKDMARAWKETSEFLRKMYNRAGGAIPMRSDWGFPQSHDAIKMGRQGPDEWVAYIKDRLDWGKMIDESTGKGFSPAEHDDILRGVYRTITEEGFNKVEKGETLMGRSLARRRQDHRFLVFKSSDEWLEYQKTFGEGDVFKTMMEHVDAMSRDISMLQLLGPNPNATIKYLQTQAQRIAADRDAKIGGGKTPNKNAYKRHENRFKDMYGLFTGTALSPDNKRLATGFSGVGEMLSAAQLGSTSLLAILGDAGTTRMTARIAGLPHSKMMARMVGGMVSRATQEEAVRAGLIAEGMASVAFGQARYIGDITGPNMTRRISDATMNLSLLSPWTQSARWGVGLEYMGYFADSIKKPFAELSSKNKRLLGQYGITSEDWTKLGTVPLYKHKGATFLRGPDIFDVDEALASKYMEMVMTQVDLSVPVASLEARAALTAGVRPGTVIGGLAKSVAQYKSFPVTLMMNNLRQIGHLDTTRLNRVGYGTEFLATTTILAAFSVQMREISKGRDPIPMFDDDGEPNLKFWGNALIVGGGMGILGDFLFSNRNRFDRGLAETAAGPRVGFLGDVLDLTVGNIQQVVTGEKTDAGREAVRFLERYTPGVSTFYARLAMQRLVFDNLSRMADPDAARRFRRIERKMMRERNQGYWWKSGESSPGRAPDLGNIVGDIGR